MTNGPGRELTLEEKVGQLCYSLHYQQPDVVGRMVRISFLPRLLNFDRT